MVTIRKNRLRVVKIGGSVLFNSRADSQLSKSILEGYSNELSINLDRILKDGIVIVLGGGSIGHRVPVEFGLVNGSNCYPPNIGMMTIAMWNHINAFSNAMRQFALPVYPFQTSGLFLGSSGRIEGHFLSSVAQAVGAGLIPVLSGDLIFSSSGRHSIVSSDEVAAQIAIQLRAARVCMLTNVPGVLARDGRVIEVIDSETRQYALNECQSPPEWDITGGMIGKLQASFRVATTGTPVIIADGRDPRQLQDIMYSDLPSGTMIRFDSANGLG